MNRLQQTWHLPWHAHTVPHAVLDIIRGCNISCNACYNHAPERRKALPEIEKELLTLQRHRRIQSIAIAGGEPLLHPDVCGVIRMLRERGLCAELFTNAVLFDDHMAARLAEAGLNLIGFHIETGQQRPDLAAAAPPEALERLRAEKSALAARHGIEAALSVTVYEDRLSDLQAAVSFVLDSPSCNYLLATLYRDHSCFGEITGDLQSGLHGTLLPAPVRKADKLTNRAIEQYVHDTFGFLPFARIGSNLDTGDTRWLSYLVAATHGAGGQPLRHALRAGLTERLFMTASRLRHGRYPMYRPQHAAQFALHLMLNGLTGGSPENFRLLRQQRVSGAPLLSKRLLFQCLAEIRADGRIVHCLNCPDAVVRNGRLVPVCLSDRVPVS